MAFRTLILASAVMVSSRRIKMDNDQMQHTTEGDKSEGFPWVEQLHEQAVAAVKKVSVGVKPLQEKTSEGWKELVNGADKAQGSMKERWHSTKSQLADTADETKNNMKDGAHIAVDKAKKSVQEGVDIAANRANSLQEELRSAVDKATDSVKEGWQTSQAKAKNTAKELEFAAVNAINGAKERVHTTQAELASGVDKAKNSAKEAVQSTPAEFAKGVDKMKHSTHEAWRTTLEGFKSAIQSAPGGTKNANTAPLGWHEGWQDEARLRLQGKPGAKLGKKDGIE